MGEYQRYNLEWRFFLPSRAAVLTGFFSCGSWSGSSFRIAFLVPSLLKALLRRSRAPLFRPNVLDSRVFGALSILIRWRALPQLFFLVRLLCDQQAQERVRDCKGCKETFRSCYMSFCNNPACPHWAPRCGWSRWAPGAERAAPPPPPNLVISRQAGLIGVSRQTE